VPRWIADDYPDYVEEYPQLAVAIGGSAPVLPKQGSEEFNFGGGLA
jgi:hypothetical protein